MRTINEVYLAHHGVKGMKWGVRRNRQSSGGRRKTSTKSSQPKPKNDFSKLSNKELKEMAYRKQLENEYTYQLNRNKQLNSVPPSTRNEGKKIIQGLLVGGGTALVSTAANTVGKELGKKIIEKYLEG